jgi:hypothetical protein
MHMDRLAAQDSCERNGHLRDHDQDIIPNGQLPLPQGLTNQ